MGVSAGLKGGLRALLVGMCLFWILSACANPDSLIDGLHRDATDAKFESYFARFLPDATFLGTDKTERWSIAAFKQYAKPIFDAGRGWRYEVVDRHWAGTDSIRWFDETLWNEKYGYCRGTGVVRATESGWRIAHYSLSFLIPNEMAAEATALSRTVDAEPCCLRQ